MKGVCQISTELLLLVRYSLTFLDPKDKLSARPDVRSEFLSQSTKLKTVTLHKLFSNVTVYINDDIGPTVHLV